MTLRRPANLRTRLTLWYVAVLAVLLVVYAALVFAFQYAVLTRQLLHDEIQDVVTVEGLLYFDAQGRLQLHQEYYSRPQSHLLIDRLMEVRDLNGSVLYRSPTLNGMPLDGPLRAGEGDKGFDERIVRLPDGTHVFMVSHIHAMNGRTLVLRLGYSLAPLRARMVQFFLLLVLTIPLALLLAGAAGQAIARRALRPVERMSERAANITASNLSLRLEAATPDDELGRMAAVFNHLLDRLEQAFVQLQRFTADAAHELRTPLAALRTIGEVSLERSQSPQQYREAIGNILEETSRLSETIDSLLLLSRAETTQPGERQTVFIASALVDEVLGLLEVVIEEHAIIVVQQHAAVGSVEVRADRSLLRMAVLNVLHNALKFSPDRATLRISYARIETPAPALEISIEDEGPGIPHGEHDRVFERFFSSSALTTAPRSGTGLGLSIAKLVIERVGGTIRFDEASTTGARCLITLPLV